MSEQKDSKGNKIKFIRKNGRVIPIKAKGSSPDSKSSKRKAPKKSKDSAARVSFDQGRAERLISKGRGKKTKTFAKKFGVVASTSLVGSLFGGKKGAAIGAIAGLFASRNVKSKTVGGNKSKFNKGQRLLKSADKREAGFNRRGQGDSFGDGSSRRAFQRGLAGGKFNPSTTSP